MKKNKCIATILAAYLLESSDDEVEINAKELPRKQRSVWRKEWIGRREKEGFCEKLLLELRAEDPQLYRNFLRMSADQFDHLLSLVTPHIQKTDTVMRASIPASNRLVMTLRFLATGESFSSLQILFRVPQNTISTIIPEVLDAIYKVLVEDFLKVSFCTIFPYT